MIHGQPGPRFLHRGLRLSVRLPRRLGSMMIGEAEKEVFAHRGVLRVRELIGPDLVERARSIVHAELESEGAMSGGSWAVTERMDAARHAAINKRLKQCARTAELAALESADVASAVAALLSGQPHRRMLDRPQILFTPPNADRWALPHKVWHCDVPRLGSPAPPGVQIFTFLDTVEARGGGTLVVAGSHRLVNDRGRVSSRDTKVALRQEAYFRDLMTESTSRGHFLERPGEAGGVEVQVVEMTGEPGDVYFTDLRILHNIAPNARQTPRIMSTQRYFLDEVVATITAPEEGA